MQRVKETDDKAEITAGRQRQANHEAEKYIQRDQNNEGPVAGKRDHQNRPSQANQRPPDTTTHRIEREQKTKETLQQGNRGAQEGQAG